MQRWIDAKLPGTASVVNRIPEPDSKRERCARWQELPAVPLPATVLIIPSGVTLRMFASKQ